VNKGREADETERMIQTHLHPVQLGVVVGLGETGKHKVIRVLQERTCAKPGWGEHGSVQGAGRVVGVLLGMCMRGGLLMVLGGRRRGGWRWEVFTSLVDDAQLNDGRRVDWPSIGCQRASECERPHSMGHKKKKKMEKQKKTKQSTERRTPNTTHPGLLRLLSYAEIVLAGPVHGRVGSGEEVG
jgi:hypothetical protein